MTVLPSAVASAALIAQLVGGKATRDTLFLDQFGLQLLPAAMIGAAIVSSIAILGISSVLARFGPAKVVPSMFALGAALFLGEWALAAQSIHATSIAVYVHTAIFGSASVSAFWSLVNEKWDPQSAKLYVGKIASGGTVGGVLGGVLVWQASRMLTVPMMLALLAGINAIGLVGALQMMPRGPRAATREDEPVAEGGFRALKETPYLRDLALLVAAGAVTQALLDWLLSAHATHEFGKGQRLLQFFAIYNMVVGIASFAAQTVLTRPLLEKLGLARTVKIQPLAVIAAAVLAAVAPIFRPVVFLRWSEATIRNSLYRSAYELFYTPLPKAKKRAAKTLVDVGFDRIGTTIGSLALLAIASLSLELASRIVLLAAMVASVAAWFLAARLHDGYVSTLAASLKSGAVALDDSDAYDLTTRKTLAETTALLDRKDLLARIDQFHKAKADKQASVAPLPPPGVESAPDVGGPAGDPLLARITTLRSGDAASIKKELARSLTPTLAAFAIPLLGDDAVVREAVRALRKVAPRATGVLLDALVDGDGDVRVRRRIPRVLKVVKTQRAAMGLLMGLEDPVFDVRVQVGLALAEMKDAEGVSLPRDLVFRAAERELADGRASWSSPRTTLDPASRDHEHDEAEREEPAVDDLQRGLHHVFAVLGLALDREPLMIAFRAARTDDPSLRGTALEYLDVVLPPKIKEHVVPLLGSVPRTHAHKARPQTELAAELLRSSAALSK